MRRLLYFSYECAHLDQKSRAALYANVAAYIPQDDPLYKKYEREMEKFIAKTDKYRGEYHKYYTGWDWEDARHYDLCLNSSKLGFEKCKEEILSYRKIRFGVD